MFNTQLNKNMKQHKEKTKAKGKREPQTFPSSWTQIQECGHLHHSSRTVSESLHPCTQNFHLQKHTSNITFLHTILCVFCCWHTHTHKHSPPFLLLKHSYTGRAPQKYTTDRISATQTHPHAQQTEGLSGRLKATIWADGRGCQGRAEVKCCCTPVVVMENKTRRCWSIAFPTLPQEVTEATEKNRTAGREAHTQTYSE